MVHALQAQTAAGALQGAWVWCARLWARAVLNHSSANGPRSARNPAAKAEAVDGYARCGCDMHPTAACEHLSLGNVQVHAAMLCGLDVGSSPSQHQGSVVHLPATKSYTAGLVVSLSCKPPLKLWDGDMHWRFFKTFRVSS